ncbi:MAG: multidrug effflux MFS transporter [Betaproteobacteria bacterium]|nr:multidrug effflux MFS transporter [Betaproteobacteria bacterium]
MRRLHPESAALVVLLGAMGAMAALSIDMALPALPDIARSLGVAQRDATLTLSVFLAGFALAQLVFGPLSDRLGRRPVLLGGSLLFSVGSLACSAAPGIGTLLAARLLAGCGAGAGMVVVLAVVRDLFDGGRARSRLSVLNLVRAIAPIVAPSIGAAVLGVGSWRGIYGLLALFGALVTLSTWLGLGETLRNPDPDALRVHRLAANYRQMLSHPEAFGHALVNALCFGCLFAYVAGSPLLMMRLLGLSSAQYGLVFAATALGIVAGASCSAQLGRRHVAGHLPLQWGLGIALLASALLLPLAWEGRATLAAYLPLLVLVTFAYGLASPNAVHGALHPMPHIAGVAGASLGFAQMATGALASALVAWLDDGRSTRSMSLVMVMCALAALLVFVLVARPAQRRRLACEATG